MVPECLLAARLAVLLVSVGLGDGNETVETPAPSCWRIGSVPGPEDLVVDRTGRTPRLLVSSQERRGKPSPPGAIYAVSTDGAVAARPLPIEGRDNCSFHPHGISLVERDGESLLYVINHHEAEDTSPRRSCLPGGERLARHGAAFTSLEVFRVGKNRLRFVQRLADPEVLTHGNDLVALPNGDVYVTSPPSGGQGALLEYMGIEAGSDRSRVIEFRCREQRAHRCVGDFRTLATVGRYVNGIEARELDGGERLVYVASSFENALYEFRVPAPGAPRPEAERSPRRIEAPRGLDNLSWTSAEKTTLLAAAHPDFRRFLQHALSPEVPSPAQIWSLDPDGSPDAALLLADSGSLISAASTGVCLEEDLVLGQVFETAVLRCSVPGSPCTGGREASP